MKPFSTLEGKWLKIVALPPLNQHLRLHIACQNHFLSIKIQNDICQHFFSSSFRSAKTSIFPCSVTSYLDWPKIGKVLWKSCQKMHLSKNALKSKYKSTIQGTFLPRSRRHGIKVPCYNHTFHKNWAKTLTYSRQWPDLVPECGSPLRILTNFSF